MGAGKGKKDDDEPSGSGNSQGNLALLAGVVVIALAVVGWLMHERAALQAQTQALHNEIQGFSQAKLGVDLANIGFSDGGKDQEVDKIMKIDPAADSAGAPELDMAEGPAGSVDATATEAGTPAPLVMEKCEDFSDQCAEWARQGECMTNKDWMVGTDDGFSGKCLKACGKCVAAEEATAGLTADQKLEKARIAEMSASTDAPAPAVPAGIKSGSLSSSLKSEEEFARCEDLSTNCKTWALHGECSRNMDFMVGGNGYEGQCRAACGKCYPHGEDPGAMAPLASTAVSNFEQRVLRTDGAQPMRALRWPAKATQSGRMCIGLSTSACSRGLYEQKQMEVLDPADRTVQKGVGGPTGCTEAYATLVTNDDQVAGVLVMLYSLRTYATADRDIMVFVTSKVSGAYVDQLLAACVIVKRVTEPLDPATHMGFVKLTLWLAVEYTKVAFIEYDSWIRSDPGEVFAYTTPAAIKTAPHARLMNEMYGSYFFLLEPSRQTFYDMLGKVGTIDSAEVIDDKTIYTERLFFSGYFEKWYMMPSALLEFQQDVVATMVPELTNTRLRRIIKTMPPFTPNTVVDFSLLPARGVFANLHVKPWHPGWRIPCAWECRYRKYHQLYEALADEWWMHYYNMIDMPLPSERSLYNLLEFHDPNGLYTKKEFEHCLNFNCEIPVDFKAEPVGDLHAPLAGAAKKGRKGKMFF